MSKDAENGELRARVGELRRLTIMFCDVVGSTELSGRLEPETYRELMGGYRLACRDVIESRFEGHILQLKGDGTLSVFGFPVAHENDAERAVRAGLALVRAVQGLSVDTASPTAESLDVRVAVHHGPVYVDFDEDDIYGLAANVGSRLHGLADPGEVIVSKEVRQLVEDHFDIEVCEPQIVRGVAEPIESFRVVAERQVPIRRSWSTPMIERDGELERLRRAWVRTAAGTADRPAGMLVRGDAGIGKSRLVAALVDEVRAANAPVVELYGSPFHVDAGFHPIRTLAEARCGIGDDTDPSERLRWLMRDITSLGLDESTVPLMAPVLGIDPSAGYDEAATSGRKLEEQVSRAVLEYLVACTLGRPAVVIAENLHWFDAATQGVLTELVRAGPSALLVVGTSRTPQIGPWDAIELAPLSPAGRFALIDALDERVSEQDRIALAKRSGGVPLYIEELVRASGVDEQATAGGAHPVPGSVPAALYEPLVARLYATPAAVPVAVTAAAAGQEVDRALLEAAMSLESEELDDTLRELIRARILEPIAGNPDRYQFRHELLREVAYELQPPSWRRKVHSRICDLLAGDESVDWHVLASHFERAERHYEAAVAYRHTAESARRRGALDEAHSHLTRAIDLVLPLADDASRDRLEIGLRLRRGFLAMSAEGVASPQASADFDRCLELAASDPHGDDMFSIGISLWAYYLARGEIAQAREISERQRFAVRGQHDYFRPQSLAGLGMLDWFAGKFTQAAAELGTATEDLARLGREEDVAAVWFVPNDGSTAMYVHLALARFMSADTAGADESLARAKAMAAELDFPQGPWSTAYALWLGSWVWIEDGRLDRAGDALVELRSSSARHGFDNWELVAATQTAALECVTALRAKTAGVATLLEHAEALGTHIELWKMIGLRVFLPFYITTAASVLAAAGDVAGARDRYEESLALAEETGMRFYDAETARCLAHLTADREAMIAELRAALDVARSQAARPFELRIALDLHALLGQAASPLVERAMRPYDEGALASEIEGLGLA